MTRIAGLVALALLTGCFRSPVLELERAIAFVKKPDETALQAIFRLDREATQGRHDRLENEMLRRRLAHVCPEAFPLPHFATYPLTNTMPKPLARTDLLRYNRCAEASGIAR